MSWWVHIQYMNLYMYIHVAVQWSECMYMYMYMHLYVSLIQSSEYYIHIIYKYMYMHVHVFHKIHIIVYLDSVVMGTRYSLFSKNYYILSTTLNRKVSLYKLGLWIQFMVRKCIKTAFMYLHKSECGQGI